MNQHIQRARQKLFIVTKQQEYLHDRKQKLERLRRDGLVDFEQLQEPWTRSRRESYPVFEPEHNPFENTTPWLKIQSMTGEWGDVLERLSSYAGVGLGVEDRAMIEHFFKAMNTESRSIIKDEDEKFVKSKSRSFGYKFAGDGIGFDKYTGIWWLREIAYMPPGLELSKNADPKILQYLRRILKFVQHLGTMRRLADLRNASTNYSPLPSGCNIRDPSLRASYMLHRAWIRTLHYRSLSVGGENTGFLQIKYILGLSLAFMAMEFIRVPHIPLKNQQNPPGFGDIRLMTAELVEALGDMGYAIISSTPPASVGENDGEEGIRSNIIYNTEPARLNSFIRMFLDPIGAKFKLWYMLLGKSADFDRAMEEEHVEDCLINKHIVYSDEEFQISNLLRSTNYIPADVRDLDLFNNDDEDEINMVKPWLQKIQQVNRGRRNYLQLKDWIPGKRPWKQLYIIFDTSVGNHDDLVGPIRDFYNKITALELQYPQTNIFNPSNEANIWKNLFPIHPLASTDLPTEAVCPNLYQPCVICFENLIDEPGKILVEILCGHRYHYVCLRNYWDQPHMLSFPCPQCRFSKINWSLAGTVGVKGEVDDVFGFYETYPLPPPDRPAVNVDGTIPPDPVYDMNDKYYAMEITRLADCALYTDERSYATVSQEHDSRPRLAKMEISLMRHYRRKKDFARRKDLYNRRRGVGFLDPGVPEPPVPASLNPSDQGTLVSIERLFEKQKERRTRNIKARLQKVLAEEFGDDMPTLGVNQIKDCLNAAARYAPHLLQEFRECYHRCKLAGTLQPW